MRSLTSSHTAQRCIHNYLISRRKENDLQILFIDRKMSAEEKEHILLLTLMLLQHRSHEKWIGLGMLLGYAKVMKKVTLSILS